MRGLKSCIGCLLLKVVIIRKILITAALVGFELDV